MSDATEAHQEFSMPTPGPEHDLLKPFEGTFRAEVQLWMGPGDPMVSTGTIDNTFQLGGLYLKQDYQGDKTDGPFPSFEGQGYWGFNTTTNKFEGFWIDNASTTMQMETGNVDESGKNWEMHSTFLCPGTGKAMKKRTVISLVDNDRHTYEQFFVVEEGQPEVKSMEINYVRA